MFNTEENGVFADVGLSLSKNTPHCSTFVLTLIAKGDHQIIITGRHSKEGFFSPQQVQQKAFKSQWPQRHLDVPEKAVGTKK